jgi:hypothetical protein
MTYKFRLIGAHVFFAANSGIIEGYSGLDQSLLAHDKTDSASGYLFPCVSQVRA